MTLVTGIILAAAVAFLPESEPDIRPLYSRFASVGVEETGSINLVTSVLLDYRAFDTLGEATVIFAAVAVVSLLFAGWKMQFGAEGLSALVKRGMSMFSPFLFVFAIYVITHGHLSPGGGFQGGVALATLFMLFSVVYGSGFWRSRISDQTTTLAESSGALTLLSLGCIAMLVGAPFLSNVTAGFDPGVPGELFSAGIIPALNLAIGMKVAAGLSSIFYDMIRQETLED